MDKLQFTEPVRIKAGSTAHVAEIYDVDDALTFLQNWQTGRLGPLYQAAMNSCVAAKSDDAAVEEARKDFLKFAYIAGILAKDEPHSPAIDNGGQLKPLSK
jgi:hypothetical protein